MKFKALALASSLVFALAIPTVSYAGTWEQSGTQWKYKQDNGQYASGQWITDQGKSYYLGQDGVMLSNMTTPDGYQVDASGAWIQSQTTTSVDVKALYQQLCTYAKTIPGLATADANEWGDDARKNYYLPIKNGDDYVADLVIGYTADGYENSVSICGYYPSEVKEREIYKSLYTICFGAEAAEKILNELQNAGTKDYYNYDFTDQTSFAGSGYYVSIDESSMHADGGIGIGYEVGLTNIKPVDTMAAWR